MSIDDNGPFDDPLFSALARRHGCHDRGSNWYLIDLAPMHGERDGDWAKATARGFDSDIVLGVPSGMPRFHFARHEGKASLMIDGGRYIYSSRGGTRQITIHGTTLPETLMAAAAGRRLSEYVDLPGAAEETIAEARPGSATGKDASVVLTLE